MKDIVHGYLLLDLIFEITSENLNVVWKSTHPLVIKGLN